MNNTLIRRPEMWLIRRADARPRACCARSSCEQRVSDRRECGWLGDDPGVLRDFFEQCDRPKRRRSAPPPTHPSHPQK